MNGERLARLLGAGALMIAMNGCTPKSPDARPTSTPFYFESNPFTGIGDVWQVIRIGENQFVVDGLPFEANLKQNRANALTGIRTLQNDFGCKILKQEEFLDYQGEAISAMKITVDDPSCIIDNFLHPVKTEVK